MKKTLEQQYKEETGLNAYEPNNLRPNIPEDVYVEWLEDKIEQLTLSRASFQREQLVCENDNIVDLSLTKGKVYEKIHEHNGMVVIINDFDEVLSYNKKAFFE